jgi:hypothetical protein
VLLSGGVRQAARHFWIWANKTVLLFAHHQTWANPKNMTTREGFAAVAEWIALDPDNETFVFQKFDTLAARNLLYMQARILSLEQQFDALDTGVTESNDMSLKDAARSWEELVKQDSEDEVRARRQMELIAETREALKEYCMYKDSSLLFKAVANQT